MRLILKKLLAILAKRVIARYHPIVIGITGSVGKSTAKEAIFCILNEKYWVWKNGENFNNEFGTPNAVLGIKSVGNDSKQGGKLTILAGVVKGFWLAYGLRQKYPKFLVLELAADRPGDIKYLADIVKPSVGVVTAIGAVPVHVEFYASPQEVADEKSGLISALAPTGLAVLNYDDQTVLDMAVKTRAKIITFGFSDEAGVWVSDVSYFASDSGQTIGGLSFTIHSGNSLIQTRIANIIGLHQIYGILAGAAIGLRFGMNLAEISGALDNFKPPRSRMTLLKGIKNSVVIDDSYNASPSSVHAALDSLSGFAKSLTAIRGEKVRKIAVLGDMKELGKYEIEAHQAIGNLAGERTDILITVGGAAKFIADSAASHMPKENILSFSTSQEAAKKTKEIVKEGDIILVKGSHSMKMELVVGEIAVN